MVNVPSSFHKRVLIHGSGLTIDHLTSVARENAEVKLTEDVTVLERMRKSCDFITDAVDKGRPVYGITTGFGGMANVIIPKVEVAELQNNLPWFLKAGAGDYLPIRDVRAGMLLRANSLVRGYSGIREEILQRLVVFLNARVTPKVCDLGSIGASGDLVPLSAVTGALIGLDKSFLVDFDGEEIDAISALARLGLPRKRLQAKEGLAMMNGTSIMTGIAANCVSEARMLSALSVAIHGLFLQGMMAKVESFEPFIHEQKPHPGQIWCAARMLEYLDGSRLVDVKIPKRQRMGMKVVQERYSIRCLPQYMGPIIDELATIGSQVEVEMNCTNDNPLIDPDEGRVYHCGNFLGQYIGVSMDRLRFQLGMLAKHLDVQIAALVAPEFNNGLSASLVGNQEREVNMGLKGLQISGNSIMPLISFYGAPLVDRYPTHAEQFNQNINSMGFGSANLARSSIELFRQHLAISLMFGLQAVDLRTYQIRNHYDARKTLSPASRKLYEAAREVVGSAPSRKRPYVWNDNEQPLDVHIRAIVEDLRTWGRIPTAIAEIYEQVCSHNKNP